MAQKDKVKELVGRGLDSYHTKSLQQIDRIEKKNKEQNHKISILSNELDNDYLTKTEEGSVVSLEHSKEGMVYLDELQGNTLVNYCTDGSKELTLNGDIDVEGTFVTTTEGVDNGKVDVMCEGNTLVNLANHPNSFTVTRTEGQTYRSYDVPILYSLKANTTYTIYLTVESNEFDHNPFTSIVIGQGNGDTWSNRVFWNKEFGKNNTDKGLGRHKAIFTTHSRVEETSFKWIKFIFESYSEYNTTIKDIVLLEGEHNEDIDNFIGMKSVGQDDENGHKIEILSQNKNLFNPQEVYEGGYSFGVPFINSTKCQQDENGVFTRITSSSSWNVGIGFHIKTEKNMDYTLSVGEYFNDGVNMDLRGFGVYKSEYPFENNNNMQSYVNRVVGKKLDSNNNSLTYNSKDYDYILFYIGGQWDENANGVKTFRMSKIEVNQSSTKPTNYTKQNSNKKEILLNEPLRSLSNKIKDKFVRIGGKWYIERNCIEFVINETNIGNDFYTEQDKDINGLIIKAPSNKHKLNNNAICDRVLRKQVGFQKEGIGYFYENPMNFMFLFDINTTIDDAKSKLIGGKILCQLETPTYEPLEINPELLCYTDITHISNNSLIPCNMKIQNSGYNAIIKPSTLYTVVLVTNKSGTIGMNLCGAKATTTNNVITLTTPSTLTDDSLRIYGKGIKGSKVRLLEGDKTNWIPSHFEGMKSSFEDKFDATDNTYKMEILSNNKNILNLNKHDGVTTYTHHGVTFTYNDKTQEFTVNGTATQDLGYQPLLCSKDRFLTFEQGKQYTLSTTTPIPFFVQISEKNVISALTLHPNTMFRNVFDRQNTNYCSTKMNYFMIWGINAGDTFNNLKFKLQIEEGSVKTEYIPNNYNKIQFSSIEPLRGIGDVKDRFVFKDNKLMIERNCKKLRLTTENLKLQGQHGANTRFYYDVRLLGFDIDQKPLCVENLKQVDFYDKSYTSKSSYLPCYGYDIDWGGWQVGIYMPNNEIKTLEDAKIWLDNNVVTSVWKLAEPTYEEIPFELQKIILEGYENGTLFFDTNIPPTSTVTYAGETPIVKATKLNKTEVLNNTNDINDNIIPYLMDMDYRVVCLQLETNIEGISMAKLFGGAYEMLKRDIQSKRYSTNEYKHRLNMYLSINKITEKEYEELGEMLNE